MPPNDAPAAFIPMTVARLRRNHRASMALVLFMDTPPAETEANTPNINTKNMMWKVRLSRINVTPTPMRPKMTIFRPPVASKIRPKNG